MDLNKHLSGVRYGKDAEYKARQTNFWINGVICIVFFVLPPEVCISGETVHSSHPSVMESRSKTGSIDMSEDSISAEHIAGLRKILADAVARMNSIQELEAWLKSRPYIESVKKADYLIKTEPPQQELHVAFKIDDGSTVMKVLDILLYPNQTFALAGLHDP